jgi:hypothetical protein
MISVEKWVYGGLTVPAVRKVRYVLVHADSPAVGPRAALPHGNGLYVVGIVSSIGLSVSRGIGGESFARMRGVEYNQSIRGVKYNISECSRWGRSRVAPARARMFPSKQRAYARPRASLQPHSLSLARAVIGAMPSPSRLVTSLLRG